MIAIDLNCKDTIRLRELCDMCLDNLITPLARSSALANSTVLCLRLSFRAPDLGRRKDEKYVSNVYWKPLDQKLLVVRRGLCQMSDDFPT